MFRPMLGARIDDGRIEPGYHDADGVSLPARLFAVVLVAIAGLAVGCAATPEPPPPVPEPQPPRAELVRLEEKAPPELPAPRPLAPRLRWTPTVPGQGTFVVLMLEPVPMSLPIFEARGQAYGVPIELVPMSGGTFIALIAAPLTADDVPVEIDATFIDGTHVRQTLSLFVMARDFPATRLRVAPRYTRPDSATLVRVAREREIIQAMRETVTPVPLWDGPFELPLQGATTSPYGQRRIFNDELRSRHTGLDIDGDTGDPVRAANSGRVALSADLFYNGGAVFIDHGLGLYTGYFHLSEREVFDGQWVEKGQVIGRVGATGRVTGPHLHWHLYVQGFSLDARSLLDPGFTRLIGRLPTSSAALLEP